MTDGDRAASERRVRPGHPGDRIELSESGTLPGSGAVQASRRQADPAAAAAAIGTRAEARLGRVLAAWA